VGLDTEKGILAIGAHLRQGQMVQFHLRDAQTSGDDLDETLSMYAMRGDKDQLSGALLFSCLGRGEFLYGHASHDSQLFQQKLGPVPVSGFFCNGEIGPVGGTTYLHGYTSCFALFRPLYVTSAAASASEAAAVHTVSQPPS
jgi:small ligand-binding sensory domain FIST